jgi:hypothetical protein
MRVSPTVGLRALSPTRRPAGAIVAGLALCVLSQAVGGVASPQAPPASAPDAPAANAAPRPGLLHIGPFFVTPRLRIGTIGLDTNVFYSATARRSDFFANGGPGLDIVLPIGDAFKFTTTGFVSYLYFLRTDSQRRWMGSGTARMDYKGARTDLNVQEKYDSAFERPNFEVDHRIFRRSESTEADLRRKLFGRTSVAASADRTHSTVPSGETFLGTDLSRTLSADSYTARLALEYALTVKTSVLVEGSRQLHRFPADASRNGAFDLGRLGVRLSSSTLVSAMVAAGLGSFRLDSDPDAPQRYVSANADLLIHVSPRTRLGGSYELGRRYSALEVLGRNPTLRTEVFGVRVEKELLGQRLDLRLIGSVSRFSTDGPIAVVLSDGTRQVARRDDTARVGSADLGYRFRGRLRVGIIVSYTGRRSTFADLGVKGLLAGATITFNP